MNFVRRFAVICAALLLVSVAVSAQTTSSLTGTVTLDGNPLPGVTVTISSPALIGTRTSVSDVNGNYNFAAIPPGTYTVKFEMESMQTVTRTSQVTLSGTGRANAEMKLTAVAEAITVTASAPAVLETTEIQSNVQQELVNHLPIQRTLQAATSLAPGVATQSGTGGAGAGAIVISGAPSYDNVFMVNGAAINENLRGQAHNLFIEDAIQETTVLTGAISAEYGRFTGGVVNAITKSGGNEFSGSIRDSLSNDKWTERGDLNTGVIGDKINHVYEATLGGYVLKDRLWFFGAGRKAKVSAGRALRDRDNTAFVFTDENKRYEGKLTGQITPKHSLVVSYLKVDNPQVNNCFGTNRCLEWSNIDLSRTLPNNFLTVHYNGILTSSLLVEGSYAKKYFAFQGSGGDFADQANGSYVGAYGFGEGYAGAPIFCGFCTDEERNNDLWGAKATYYLASKGFGTHNLVVGYDDWAEQRIANNYQSGSNFAVYSYNDLFKPNCYAAQAGVASSVACHPTFVPSSGAGEGDGDLIKWAPIFELTKGSDFKTQSLYVNDKWDFSDHWNFNIGLRYDKNDGADSSGEKVAKDSEISPRLGLIYDIKGDGRYRINASYSKYVSRVAETIGSSGAGGGNPSYVYYEYLGPTVNADHKLTTSQALAQVFAWFNANGGLSRDFLFGNISGLST
ncbi:MAG TPA: TonB-dependent receptor, partial [Thermoanaerobaculia bacterium]|nr:TonB-dependent receptor [Thermoanaerobaculia bacterium]